MWQTIVLCLRATVEWFFFFFKDTYAPGLSLQILTLLSLVRPWRAQGPVKPPQPLSLSRPACLRCAGICYQDFFILQQHFSLHSACGCPDTETSACLQSLLCLSTQMLSLWIFLFRHGVGVGSGMIQLPIDSKLLHGLTSTPFPNGPSCISQSLAKGGTQRAFSLWVTLDF